MAKNVNLEETLLKYTKGEATLEETNKALKDMGSNLTLNPMRNMFTADELMNTKLGDNPPATVNGYGIMDHGVGSMEKVHIVNGKTPDVNMGEEIAFVYVAGAKFQLKGDTLVVID